MNDLTAFQWFAAIAAIVKMILWVVVLYYACKLYREVKRMEVSMNKGVFFLQPVGSHETDPFVLQDAEIEAHQARERRRKKLRAILNRSEKVSFLRFDNPMNPPPKP